MGSHGRNGLLGQITRAVPSPPVAPATSAAAVTECLQVRSCGGVCPQALRAVKGGGNRRAAHRSYSNGSTTENPAHMIRTSGTPARRKSLVL